MAGKRFDVVALGEAMLEFNQTEAGDPRYLQGFGGDTSNAAIAAARAGVRAAYLTRVGADWFGRQLLDLWRDEGVDTSGVETDPASATGIYFVHHGAEGHAFSYLRQGSAASRMTPAWLPLDIVRSAGILHVSGISLAISGSAFDTVIAAMQAARDAGTRVSLDSNLRLKLWSLDDARAGIARAASLCDVFLPSLEDMETLLGFDDPDRIVDWGHAQGATTVALKLGAEGCLVSDGKRRLKVPGQVATLVDATGAGDCFCGNFLARLAEGADAFEAARFANAAAALAVQGYGAVDPLPRRADVEAAVATPN